MIHLMIFLFFNNKIFLFFNNKIRLANLINRQYTLGTLISMAIFPRLLCVLKFNLATTLN